MCQITHRTREWPTYPHPVRELAEFVVMPWVVLRPDRCVGPHHAGGPDGSYSLLALTSQERVAKVFIMEDSGPLPPGVYVGIRSHSATSGLGGRTPAETRIWDPAAQLDPHWSPYYRLLDPVHRTIGLTPQHDVCFAYFMVPPTPAWTFLSALAAFLEHCRQAYGP